MRIGRLNCEPDKALTPCDLAAPPPLSGVTGLHAAASDEDYRKSLAATLKSIVCATDDGSIFVLRGVSKRGPFGLPSRLATTDVEAPALIDFIMSPTCWVSTKLIDDDKAALLRFRQDAPKRSELEESGG